ncbi:MAG: excisionase family DNA-binding protein [Rhodospirillaceae bacterium]
MANAIRERRVPTPQEALLAGIAGRFLAAQYQRGEEIQVGECGEERVNLPPGAVELLLDILGEMANGNAVTILPLRAELTTQQAADILNVSRPYLISLLEKKEIPSHRIGTHRRVYAEDIFAFKEREIRERKRVLDRLAALDQELGLD